jgi:hypothetical protein
VPEQQQDMMPVVKRNRSWRTSEDWNKTPDQQRLMGGELKRFKDSLTPEELVMFEELTEKTRN